jgi:hypothetical protein
LLLLPPPPPLLLLLLLLLLADLLLPAPGLPCLAAAAISCCTAAHKQPDVAEMQKHSNAVDVNNQHPARTKPSLD